MFFLTSEEMLTMLTDPETLGNEDGIGVKKTPEPSVENPYPGTKTVISMNDMKDLPWVTTHCKWLLLQIGVTREVEKNVVLVHMLNARDLKAVDNVGKEHASCDPFVVCQVGVSKFKTSPQKQTCFPVWDKYFEFTGLDVDDPKHNSLDVRLFDWNRTFAAVPMGRVGIPLVDMGAGEYKWYKIMPCDGCPDPQGEIRLSCCFYPLFPEPAASTESKARSTIMQLLRPAGGSKDEATGTAPSLELEGSSQADVRSRFDRLEKSQNDLQTQMAQVISLLQAQND
eukprot:COSAG02_NODE_5855_length_3987_cov_2.574331_1_plen_283_part_00